jgi:ACS family hexuronate transporter-like MFS transporter
MRWWICALLFIATTLNYLDRQTLSVLASNLQKAFHFNEADYGWINFGFQSAYAILFTLAGRLVDILGSRVALGIGVFIWSLAAMSHALARGALGFGVARFMLGAGESVNFPASLKAVAEWFPPSERALATGVFNSGSNAGVIFGVFAVWLAAAFEWQLAFIIIGSLGLLWLILWWRTCPKANPSPGQDRAAATEPAAPIPSWTALLRCRQVWPFLLAKFLTDPVWWFYLYWLPKYLHNARHLDVLTSAGLTAVPYIAASVGSVAAGWMSGALMHRGWTVGPSRYAAMGVCAICMPGAIVAVFSNNLWMALFFISLATAAHQGWSANLFTTATDLFPTSAAGSVIGLGGATGAIGGMLMTLLVGGALQWTHSYVPIFVWAGLMHPLSWVIFRVLAGPEMARAEIRPGAEQEPSAGLLTGGLIVAVVGAVGLAVVAIDWAYLCSVSGESAAAGGIATAVGIMLIGLALIYASRSHSK